MLSLWVADAYFAFIKIYIGFIRETTAIFIADSASFIPVSFIPISLIQSADYGIGNWVTRAGGNSR